MFDKNQPPVQKLTNSKLALFQEMQNCVETTGFVFKNVALFVSYPKIQPWKSRLGYVNRFWNECSRWFIEQSFLLEYSAGFSKYFILIG